MTNILIIGNARDEKLSKWNSLIENSDIIIACDGAIKRCIEQQINVDYLIGDMDSITQEILQQAKSSNVKIVEMLEQNNNDLTKAILFSQRLEPESVNIIGVDGGNSEHQFCNYMSLIECNSNAKIHLDDCTVCAVRQSEIEYFSIEIGTLFSVFSIGTSLGVNLTGAKWELENSKLTPSSTGLHNIATSERIGLYCESGSLLLFVNR